MMRKNYFYALMAVALALTACSKDIPEKDKLPSGNTITILANVAPQSRAPQLATDGSGNFSKGDVLSLYVGGNGISTVATDFAYDSEVLTWGKLGLAENVKQVTFASCYPKQMVGEEGTFEFNSLQTSEADLLLAPAKTVAVGTAEPVSMTFVHALHHLILTFEPGNGYTADDLRELSLTLHAKTTCVVDAAKGSIESVKNIVVTFKLKNYYIRMLFVIILSFVSSFAIHIGRYARLNSWDIFTRPGLVIDEILNVISWNAIHFVLGFTFLQVLCLIFLDRENFK